MAGCPAAAAAPSALAELIEPMAVDAFFAEVWQREPRVFPLAAAGEGSPRGRLVAEQTWEQCLGMLAMAWGASPAPPPEGCELLVFKAKQITHEFEDLGPCTALLHGASCVVNHAEYVWPPFSELSLRLRQQLLHVYVNSYVTPPASQAAPPHADDRDVFVLQLCGSKHWRVYREPPIRLPYTDEQVGKEGRPIPQETFKERAIECILQPGDVLYMPRGYVHEAYCAGGSSSWHATLAVATFDWSWARVFLATLCDKLDAQPGSRWRAALPLSLAYSRSEEEEAAAAVEELGHLLDYARKAVTVGDLGERLEAKVAMHNRNQDEAVAYFREALANAAPPRAGGPADSHTWGHWRALLVRGDTRVRRATEEEEVEELAAGAARERQGKGRGKGGGGYWNPSSFIVRGEIANAAFDTMRELDRRRGEGMLVSEFTQAVPDARDCAQFDELSRLCLARACVGNGSLRLVADRHE